MYVGVLLLLLGCSLLLFCCKSRRFYAQSAAVCSAADKELAAARPEWLALPAALQDVLVKGWLDKRRQQASSDAPAETGVPSEMNGSSSSSSSGRGVLGGVPHESACFATADRLAVGVSGEALLLSQQSAQLSLLQQQQKEQQQVAAILQRGRNQQQQQLEQQPRLVPKGSVAGVAEAMAALVLQLRSTALLS
jgi:hypothetical protein